MNQEQLLLQVFNVDGWLTQLHFKLYKFFKNSVAFDRKTVQEWFDFCQAGYIVSIATFCHLILIKVCQIAVNGQGAKILCKCVDLKIGMNYESMCSKMYYNPLPLRELNYIRREIFAWISCVFTIKKIIWNSWIKCQVLFAYHLFAYYYFYRFFF